MRDLRAQLACSAWLACAVGLAGAPVRGEEPAVQEPPITEGDREHWSFVPPTRPQVPAVEDESWPAGTIDRFILARLEAAGLGPLPPADRVTLIRRATLDVTGLPPTPEEVDRFVADREPRAYERLIDRLLASPAYGERWAQHWLDLARFAETDGFEHDKVRPQAWRYRDWVIAALNDDMPYDRFITLQIAGDEISPGDRDAAVATGFALCGPDMPDINLQAERRHMVLNELTGSVGSALLGLQLGCAECHNHKYDPLSQADFYRLRALFEPAVEFKKHEFGRVLHESGGSLPASHMMIRGDFRRPGPEVQPGFPRVLNADGTEVADADPGAETSLRRTALARWLTQPDHPLTARVIVNRLWQFHFGRGLVATPSDFGTMGEEPTHPALLDWLATELVRQDWSLKRMHRLMLTSAAYRQASRPTTPGWSAEKAQAAKASWAAGGERDPENQLLWRMNRRRLEGEAIRDCMLAASERLSPRRGGPGVMPPLPQELLVTLIKGQWTPSPDEEDHRRRSIYLFVRRNLRYPLFEVFDRPDTNASCPRRARSTIAPQALVLLNSEFSLDSARHLAGYVLGRAGDDPAAQVELCYRRVLARRPDADEAAAGVAFLREVTERLQRESRAAEDLPLAIPQPEGIAPAAGAALSTYCLALFNLNEFVYAD